MAFHSFGGWKSSLFGDHHMHGPEGVRFYTRLKTAGSRMTQRPGPYEHLRTDAVFDSLEAFEAAAGDRGVSPAGLALAWCLAHPNVTAVIVGPRRPEHLDPVREALELSLSDVERDELTGLFA
jgi:aryl-alcohol dehydrogenase-like predicted oxidoreductase